MSYLVKLFLGVSLLLGTLTEPQIALKVIDTCPLDKFAAALDSLTKPDENAKTGAIIEWNDREAVINRYKSIAYIRNCTQLPTTEWPISTNRTNPLIINAGEGTTGTRFLNCFMRRIGLPSAHTRGEKDGRTGEERARDNRTEFLGCSHYGSCTAGWDQFNYISDSPVAYQIWELLQSHPDAIVFQSLRQPQPWKKSRISKHMLQNANKWHQAGPCGMADHQMDHEDTELDYVVYNAWARCILPPRSIAFSFFSMKTHSVLLKIMRALRLRRIPLILRYPGATREKTMSEIAHDLEEVCGAEPLNATYIAMKRNKSIADALAAGKQPQRLTRPRRESTISETKEDKTPEGITISRPWKRLTNLLGFS
eukprot:m.305966 g.305966  ORF g.305966 m.305966 type:complete len:367 (+) comp16453_c0_seq1:153-1253(+)